jgi:hypothetical protein
LRRRWSARSGCARKIKHNFSSAADGDALILNRGLREREDVCLFREKKSQGS